MERDFVGGDALHLPPNASLDVSPSDRTLAFEENLVEAAADLSLEEVRRWSEDRDDALSGLALFLLLERRLPELAGSAGLALATVASVDSVHAAGLAARMRSLRAISTGARR